MTRINTLARTAWSNCQMAAVFTLCFAASLALPVALFSIGFQVL